MLIQRRAQNSPTKWSVDNSENANVLARINIKMPSASQRAEGVVGHAGTDCIAGKGVEGEMVVLDYHECIGTGLVAWTRGCPIKPRARLEELSPSVLLKKILRE